jgi:hypothetical protein
VTLTGTTLRLAGRSWCVRRVAETTALPMDSLK